MANVISITAGSGYFGSTYSTTSVLAGQWYADETAITGATALTYVMESKNEGTKITYRETAGTISNAIKMHTPNQISGLIGDFDASRSDLLTLVGSAVSLVTSRAGSAGAWTLSQSTAANRPTYSATARNSKPGVSWVDSGDVLNIDTPANLPIGTTPCTIQVAAYNDSEVTSTWKGVIGWGGSATSRSIAKDNLGNVASGAFSAGQDNKTTITWLDKDRIVGYTFQSDGTRLYVDGDPTATHKALTNPSTPNTTGAKVGDLMKTWQEIFLYNRVLTTDERQLNEAYLAYKWYSAATLHASHPYKSTPPIVGFKGDAVLGELVSVTAAKRSEPAAFEAILGEITTTGAFQEVIDTVVESTLGEVVGLSALTNFMPAQVVPVLGELIGEGTLTAFLEAESVALLDEIIGTGTLSVPADFEVLGTLGQIVGESAITASEPVTLDITLGELVGEGSFALPASDFVSEVILGELVGEGELESYEVFNAEALAVLDELVGEGELTTPEVFDIDVSALLGGLVGSGAFYEIPVDWLIVEDGTIVPNANSYISQVWAEEYLASLGYDDFVAGTNSEKQGAITRATSAIDVLYGDRYPGEPVNGRSQPLLWPRKDAVDLDDEPILETEVPFEIKKAVAEAAYLEWLQPGYLMPNWTPDQLVTSEKLGPLSVTYSDPSAFGRGGNMPTLTKIDGILDGLLGAPPNMYFGSVTRI